MERPPLSSRQIYLNSKDGILIDSNSTSKVFFHFKDILAPPLTCDMEVSVVNASIPMSFYVINNTNNTLVFNTNQTYTIPVGNYNALQLANNLSSNIATFTNVQYN